MSGSDKLFQDGVVYAPGNTLQSGASDTLPFAERLLAEDGAGAAAPSGTGSAADKQVQQLQQWLDENPSGLQPHGAARAHGKKGSSVAIFVSTAVLALGLGAGAVWLSGGRDADNAVPTPDNAVVDTLPTDGTEEGEQQVVVPEDNNGEGEGEGSTAETTAPELTTPIEPDPVQSLPAADAQPSTTTALPTTEPTTIPTTPAPTAPPGVQYKVVHIEGITLPAGFGDGYLNPDAALWVVNQLRTMYGRPALEKGDSRLENVSRLRLDEVMDSFKTTRNGGRKFSSALVEAGIDYSYCCESIAYGQFTAEHVVSDWMQSKSSRENMYDERMKYAFITCKQDEEGVPLWVFEAIAP